MTQEIDIRASKRLTRPKVAQRTTLRQWAYLILEEGQTEGGVSRVVEMLLIVLIVAVLPLSGVRVRMRRRIMPLLLRVRIIRWLRRRNVLPIFRHQRRQARAVTRLRLSRPARVAIWWRRISGQLTERIGLADQTRQLTQWIGGRGTRGG